MTNSPILSVVVTCYNQEQYIDETLNSVLNQSHKDWECIIVNDGSTDKSGNLISKWLEKDERFKYVVTENKGVSYARNQGVSSAKGQFIMPLDGDDLLAERYLELGLEVLKKKPSIKLVYCKAEKFGSETGEWKLPKYNFNDLLFVNSIFCSAIFKREDWKVIGGYDENMLYGLEDWEFWINLLKNGGEVLKLDYTGFFYRIKEVSRQLNINKDKERKEEMLSYISVKHADLYVENLGSFHNLIKTHNRLNKKHKKVTTNKRAVANLFFKTFFGLKIFRDNF